jgi:glycosyltransferase involved in cell wall biosynthesis
MMPAPETRRREGRRTSALTAVVLTRNEEEFIADCLASLRWCDEVIVVDSLSSDRTVEIAQTSGAAVVARPFRDFADQRNAALDLVENEWALFVDADERVTPELAAEIRAAILDDRKVGWKIPTHNYLRGRLALHGLFFPDYHLRLFRKDAGRYDPRQIVHEQVVIDGQIGLLVNPLVHISCHTWAEFIDHQDKWADFKARIQYERGVRPTYHFILGPLMEFARRFVYHSGYKDGVQGLTYSAIFSYYILVMYVRLWRLWR